MHILMKFISFYNRKILHWSLVTAAPILNLIFVVVVVVDINDRFVNFDDRSANSKCFIIWFK